MATSSAAIEAGDFSIHAGSAFGFSTCTSECRSHHSHAPGAPTRQVPITARLPVLSTSDRRDRRDAAARIVTRDGNPSLLKAAGFPYSQLGRLPK